MIRPAEIGRVPVRRRSIASFWHATRQLFEPGLEGEAKTQLQRPRRVAGRLRDLHAIRADTIHITGMIEHVEEIRVDAQTVFFFERYHLEKRSVLVPLEHSGKPLV